MAESTLFARNGALWVQINGPNTAPELVTCADVDAIAEPGGGIADLIRCFRVDGQGWDTIGATLTPPDPVTTTLTTLAGTTQGFLEQIKNCPGNYFILSSETGRKDSFSNYVRAAILRNAYISDRGLASAVMRDTDEPTTRTYGLSAFPPVYYIFKKATARQSVGMATSANTVAFLDDVRCASGAGPAQRACKIGFIAGDTPTGSPSGTVDIYYTTNYGQTWAATAADPFAASEIVNALAVVSVGATTRRVIAMRGTTDAGNPAEIAYSDDDGTTWTTVNLGSTNAQFGQGPGSLFALDQRNIWAVAGNGFVYFSEDGGAIWTTQDAGVAMTSQINAVHFADQRAGFAVGNSDDVIRSIDGGVSWGAVGDVGSGGNLRTVFTLDAQKAWVGTDNGRLYYTEDGGTTWTRRSFSGDGVGGVRDIKFVSELIGFMIHDTAAPVGRVLTTMDGGYTWEAVTTTTNAGLNALAVCDENNFYAAGEVESGTAVLLKVQPKV